jgi:hypothetical protein
MKTTILSLCLLLICTSATFAQRHKGKKFTDDQQTVSTMPTAPVGAASTPTQPIAPATTLKADDMAFTDAVHDFGTVEEGPDATCVFNFVNNGKEPIIIQKASPSCGCTVPSFSSEPVAPGATGTINVAYHTKGKPTAFTKTISVVSNAGTKVLTIKGNVEKAPTGSVPENTSMIRTN